MSVSAAFSSSSASFSSSCSSSFRAVAILFAQPSAFLLEFTNTRHCPPSLTQSMQRFSSSFFFGVSIGLISSPKYRVSLQNTPSLRSTGLQSEVTSSAPSQEARAPGFPIVAVSPIIWRFSLRCRSLVITISSVAPRSSESMRCASSRIRHVILLIHGVLFRRRESTFSEVAMTISFLPRYSSLLSKSPVAIPIFGPLPENSSYFSEARAFNGTTYRHLPRDST